MKQTSGYYIKGYYFNASICDWVYKKVYNAIFNNVCVIISCLCFWDENTSEETYHGKFGFCHLVKPIPISHMYYMFINSSAHKISASKVGMWSG